MDNSFNPDKYDLQSPSNETAKEDVITTTTAEDTVPQPVSTFFEGKPKIIEKKEADDEVDIPVSPFDMQDEIDRKHTNTAKKTKKKRFSFLLFVAVNVIVIAITAIFEFGGGNTEDGSNLGEITASIANNWYYLICAVACFLGIYFFQVLKINQMIKVTTGTHKIRATIHSVILGKYYDNITPLAIGGQPFQAYYLAKQKVPVGTATAAPVVQLFLGTCGFLTLALTAFIFFGNEVESTLIKVCAYVGFGINCMTPLAILFFSLLPNLTTKIVTFFIKLFTKLHLVKDYDSVSAKAIKTITDYRSSIGFMWRSKGTIVFGYLTSILEKLSEASITYFVMMACFNGQVDYLSVTALTLFIYAATSFVPTPGTAGAAEGSFYIVFGSFWPMFIWRLFSYYSYLACGFILIIIHGISKNRKTETASTKQKK